MKLCEPVKVLGSNNVKETLKFRPVCKKMQISDESEGYIRLWEYDKKVFQYQQKLDFFPKDFFEGKWLYYSTYIRTTSEVTPKFMYAKIVEFHPSLGKLDVLEVNDLRLEDEDRVLFIPVEWLDYEIAKNSEYLDPAFSERLKDVPESQRHYLRIKFDELVKNELQHYSESGKTLKSVVISKDYISFDIEVSNIGGTTFKLIRYAFKRYVENKNYREKKWFKTDHLLFFPLHFVKREYYEDPGDHTLLDEYRLSRAARFDPQSREILWYFSENSPQTPWVRNLAYEAESLINKAFQKAGRDSDHTIKITLDKSGADKKLGDIRYNILNLVLSKAETEKQFLKGRNVANPFTGEVVSATANIWLTSILNDYISLIRKYIRFHVYPPVWKMRPFSEDMMDFIDTNREARNLQCPDLSQEPLGVTPFFHEKISSVCKEVSDFIEKNRGQVFHPTESDLEDDALANSCAQKLAKEKIRQSILRQMLHSLGLENMLSASFDSENFYKGNEIERLFGNISYEMITDSHPDPPQYSSVMDTMDLQYPILSVPGKLDIAALRFLYFDKVDLKEKTVCCPLRKEAGVVLEVPSGADSDPEHPQKSILQRALDQGYRIEDLKKYKMCGADKEDPVLCEKGYGASPLEIVSNILCQRHNELLFTRNRYEASKIEFGNYIGRTLTLMHKKWQKYRDDILEGEGKSIEDYSFLNPKHIEEYDQIIEKAKEAPEIKAYVMVRNILFDYLKRLAFVPAKHCIYREYSETDKAFHYKAIALENIEERILNHYP